MSPRRWTTALFEPMHDALSSCPPSHAEETALHSSPAASSNQTVMSLLRPNDSSYAAHLRTPPSWCSHRGPTPMPPSAWHDTPVNPSHAPTPHSSVQRRALRKRICIPRTLAAQAFLLARLVISFARRRLCCTSTSLACPRGLLASRPATKLPSDADPRATSGAALEAEEELPQSLRGLRCALEEPMAPSCGRSGPEGCTLSRHRRTRNPYLRMVGNSAPGASGVGARIASALKDAHSTYAPTMYVAANGRLKQLRSGHS